MMNKKKISLADRVLDYMQTYGSITSMEAFTELGITRLAAHISILKDRGYKISGSMENLKNRWGDEVRFKRYRLVEDGNGRAQNVR